jgi:signal transduction histidine kinase
MSLDTSNLNLFLSLVNFRWSSFSIYAIASVMSVSLRLNGLELRGEFFIASIGMGLLITLITALLLVIGFWLIEVLRSLAQLLVIPMLMAVGAVRGAILHIEISAFGYENKISFWASVLSSSFYTAIYYSGASLFIELRSRRKNQFQAEFQRATLLRLGPNAFSASTDSNTDYQNSMDAIKRAIQQHLPVSPTQLPDTEQVTKVAAEIRGQIQMVIRPLSHRLWIGSMGEIKATNGSRILLDTLQELAIPARFILLYQFSVGLFGIGISIGFANGMAKTIPALIGTYLCFLFFNFLRRQSLISWQVRTSIFLFALSLVPIVFAEVFSSLIGIEVDWLAALIIAPTLPIVVVISSLVTLVARDRKFAVAAVQSVSLKQLNSGTDFSDEISELELSGYLHNNLQSELLRIAHQLDSTRNGQMSGSAGKILGDLDNALNRSISEVHAIQSAGIERINALPKAWEGIADIDMSITLDSPIAANTERVLTGFLEEIITNSIRYGGATALSINVFSGEEIRVEILHNGKGSVDSGNGLGAIWIPQLSKGSYQIKRKRRGTFIKFTL